MITNTDLPFHFILACKIDSHFNTMRLMHSIFLGVLTRINIFLAFTTQFCKNWNFSLKMIVLILILVSKTSKSKAKWPEQASNVSKASKDRLRNQKFQHWNKQKAWFITKLQPATARWNSLPYQRRNQKEMQLKILKWCLTNGSINGERWVQSISLWISHCTHH